MDVKEYIGYCTEHQLKHMFTRFYQTLTDSYPQDFTNAILSHKKQVSPAQIQGYFMQYKNADPSMVVKNVNKIWSEL